MSKQPYPRDSAMLTATPMQMVVDTTGEICIVRVEGDLRLWGKQGLSDHVRDTLHSLMAAGKKRVILNLSGVTRIDSRGVGCLARCHATSITQGADLRLVLDPGMILDTLTQLNFVRVCPVYPDEAAAAAAFSKPSAAS